jgi:hypothetical protein
VYKYGVLPCDVAVEQDPGLEGRRKSLASTRHFCENRAKGAQVFEPVAPSPIPPARPVGVVMPMVEPLARANVDFKRPRLPVHVAKVATFPTESGLRRAAAVLGDRLHQFGL